MSSRQAVHHDVVTLLKGLIDELVGRLEEGEHVCRRIQISSHHVLRDAISEVFESWIVLIKVLAHGALAVDDVENLQLIEDVEVLRGADIANIELSAGRRVLPYHVRRVERDEGRLLFCRIRQI